jgi:hypothetical protein
MNDEEQVPQARAPAAPADPGETPVEKLEALGVRGILWQLARDGQLIDLRCNVLLGKRMSPEEIAKKLDAEKVPTIHGTNRWTAASVRKVFVYWDRRSVLPGACRPWVRSLPLRSFSARPV